MSKADKFPREILLVEDEAVSQRELTRVLRRQGFEVRQASSSHDAVQQAESSDPAVVLMDIFLGDKEEDGIDAACEIQKAHPFTSIIFISAYAADPLYHEKVDQKQLRVSAWFEKPIINLSELIDTISSEMKKVSLRWDLAKARAQGVEPEVFLRRAVARDREITQSIIQELLVEADRRLEEPLDVKALAGLTNSIEHSQRRLGYKPPLATLLGVSHELKNIFNHLALTLHNIQGDLLLLEGAKATRERITAALREVDRGAGLVKVMFHAAHASEADPARIAVDIYEICRRAVEDLEPMTVAKEVDCIFQCSFDDAAEVAKREQLIGYPDKILTAVKNVLQNAIEASPRCSQVYVEVAMRPDAATIRISDRGQGIPDSARKRIFEPHFTTKGLEGSGLGLSIARDIIERLHLGLIKVTSSSVGSCFAITLPFHKY